MKHTFLVIVLMMGVIPCSSGCATRWNPFHNSSATSKSSKTADTAKQEFNHELSDEVAGFRRAASEVEWQSDMPQPQRQSHFLMSDRGREIDQRLGF